MTKFDFSKPIVWTNWKTAEAQFFELVEKPPIHSVVIEIAPSVAKELLKMTNSRNRPLRERKAQAMGEKVVASGNYELTGDTLKFDTNGALLDGQHRLTACAASPDGLVSHVVFGLPPAIFDVLDLGSKRTVSDALSLEGFSDPFVLSGALNFIRKYEAGLAGADGGISHSSAIGAITPREAIALLNGDYADVAKWTKYADRIYKTYKFPPSIVCGVLYLASRSVSERRVKEFAEAWVSGTRDGVNKNFDDLARRIHAIRASNNGSINRGVTAALLIVTWNYWNAGLPLTARALSWSKAYKFPTVEGDAKVAARKARNYEAQDTSLQASCLRMIQAVRRHSDAKGVCSVAASKLADEASIHVHQAKYILAQLVREGFVSIAEQGGKGPGSFTKYAITAKGFSALSRAPLPEEAVAAE